MAQETEGAAQGGEHKQTYHDLQKMTIGRLRELAQSYDDLEGVTGMSKEKLVDVLAHKKGIPIPHKVVTGGIDKAGVKGQIRELKKTRDAALESKDREQLRRVRQKLHRLRHQLRRAATVTS
jgi:hypothetical protein